MDKKDFYIAEVSQEELWLIIELFFKGLGVLAEGMKIEQDNADIFKLFVGSKQPLPILKEVFKDQLAAQPKPITHDEEHIKKCVLEAMRKKPQFMN
ncbi:hypothetical protein [Algicola sagamiensis]|uniref:hypothetical protein n=1 Tax=Algicola sagamiensis TaxID=163869 RepID=UPI0003667174|nr:hypothetical protein [Algicola sagamiensis]